jgi:hypothetical protein
MRSKKAFVPAFGFIVSMLVILPLVSSCSHSPPDSPPAGILMSEINPTLPGPVTFFASIKVLGATTAPTGLVTFSDESKLLGTVALGHSLTLRLDSF